MVRKIRKSPLAFPLLEQSSADESGEGHEAGKASALTDASKRQSVRPIWRSSSSSLDAGAPCRGDGGVLLSESRVGEHIARELRGLYEPIIAQPTPDRFIELLNRLEAGTIYHEKVRAPEE